LCNLHIVYALGIAVTGASDINTNLVSSNQITNYSFVTQPFTLDRSLLWNMIQKAIMEVIFHPKLILIAIIMINSNDLKFGVCIGW